jgi:cytochrome c nitrite reductase small subunit
VAKRSLQIPVVALCLATGVGTGVGAYTFYYARGGSYLSDDPTACVNCHIMRDQYDSWQKSSHHAVATCNDCHTPAGMIPKYLTKTRNGYHHSRAFTLQDFHEPIQIKPINKDILKENCFRCHQEFVQDIMTPHRPGPETLDCVRCHHSVGHGARR